MKKCHGPCKRELPLDCFSKNSHKKDNLSTECKDCRKLYMTSYYAENQQKINNENKRRGKQRHHAAKLKCIEHYSAGSMSCQCCPEKHLEFLSIDHIDGGGTKDRETFKGTRTFYEYLVKSNFPKGLRVLCFNCNLSRGFFGYCPHEREV